jgi:hypothetical protein
MANICLKTAIVQSQRPAYGIERKLGFWPSKLSKIISGVIKATDPEKAMLAQILGKQVAEIFPAHVQLELDLDFTKNHLPTKETTHE